MVRTYNSATTVGILDHHYPYKSVVTQIPHDSGLSPVHLAETEYGTAVCEAVTLSLGYSGGQNIILTDNQQISIRP